MDRSIRLISAGASAPAGAEALATQQSAGSTATARAESDNFELGLCVRRPGDAHVEECESCH